VYPLGMINTAAIQARFDAVEPFLNERERRLPGPQRHRRDRALRAKVSGGLSCPFNPRCSA
jgi:hypothetical protein